MHTLTHFRFCPASRAIRLALAELEIEAAPAEVWPWEWRPEFLALNPAGELPVLQLQGGPLLCGAYAIAEFIGEEVKTHPRHSLPVPLFPGNREERAEVRRLVDWFAAKFAREIGGPLIETKIWPLFQGAGQASPDTDMLRAVRANLGYHLGYIAWLVDHRNWLAGNDLSFADLMAGAQLSCLDYLGEVPWDQHPAAKVWYQRLKSRRAFQTLLADRIPGSPPPMHYTNLDF